MSRQSLIEYVTGLLKLYKQVSKLEKTKLLNQAEMITGKSRRTIMRYMCKSPEALQRCAKIQGRGRDTVYCAQTLLPHIRKLWKAMEFISAERMVMALPIWLPHYVESTCSHEIRQQLLSMSRCTLDRLLTQLRQENKAKRGLATTTSGLRAFKAKIPINTLDHRVTKRKTSTCPVFRIPCKKR